MCLIFSNTLWCVVFAPSFVRIFYFTDGDRYVREVWSSQDYIFPAIEVSQAQSGNWLYEKRRCGLVFHMIFFWCGSVRVGLCVVMVP